MSFHLARIAPACAALLLLSCVAVQAATPLVPDGAMTVPGQPLASFDIGTVDAATGLYALADRSNHAVDVFAVQERRFAWRASGFTGTAAHGSGRSGPNGVAFVGPHQLWAGDGDSSVKVIDTGTHRVVASIATGGKQRVDELADDPADGLVLAANNADRPAFLTLISTAPPYAVVARITMPRATSGLEQPVWDPAAQLFYVAIPVLDGHAAKGGVAVLDPRRRTLVRIEALSRCEPAGLVLGPRQHLLAACSDDAVAQGYPAKSVILDAASGKLLATIHEVGGTDEAAYDPHSRSYDLAAVANPGGPVLGIIDAVTDRWQANLPTGKHAHSVAADGGTGDVFVPVAADPASPVCPAGCVRVYIPAP